MGLRTCFGVTLVTGVLVPFFVSGQAGDVTLRAEAGFGVAGADVETSVEIDVLGDGLVGWSLSLRPPTSEVTAVEIRPGLALLDPPPDFYQPRIEAEGVTIAVVYFGPGTVFLPPGVGHEIHRVTWSIPPTASGVVPLLFTDDVGVPPVATSVVPVGTGQSIIPDVEEGSITIVPGVVRGDANGDGTIDIADPVRLSGHLFQGGPPLGCTDAGDANDDGTLDVADIVSMLTALFGSGSSPLDGACGPDSTLDGLDCVMAGCP